MRRVLGTVSSMAFGAVDGVVKNADLAAGRTQVTQQRSAWLEAGTLLVGLILVMSSDSAVGEGLLAGAEAVAAERGGMWGGQRITRQGPGRLVEMPQLIDASVTPMPMSGGHYLGPNPMGGVGLASAIYPAQREPAGILG